LDYEVHPAVPVECVVLAVDPADYADPAADRADCVALAADRSEILVEHFVSWCLLNEATRSG